MRKRTLVESLKRLFHSTPKRVTKTKLTSMLNKGKLTQEEFDYIISDDTEE